MKIIRLPSKFKYFALTIFLDGLFINLAFAAYIDLDNYSPTLGFYLWLFWFIANLLFYPNSNRRYTSYIHTYYNALPALIAFNLLYTGYLLLHYPNDWKFGFSFIKFFIIVFTVVFLGKALFVFALRLYRKWGYGFSRYLLLGEKHATDYMQSLFDKRPEGGYRFVAALQWSDDILKQNQTVNLRQFLESKNIDEVYAYITPNRQEETESLISTLNTLKISLYLIPFDSAKHLRFYHFRRINSNGFQEIIFGPLERLPNRILKRAFDLVFSLLVIIALLWWLLPILAILIRLDSKGRPFFVQKRAGKNQQYYACFKLRSMYINPTSDKQQAVKNDPRITRIGSFLRTYNLDELPQFFNVLLGQMSVVGPRPHIELLNQKFAPLIEGYNARFRIKPGITGLSQIHGYRGETPTIAIMKRRVDVDRLYVQNWTLLLDLQIILSTVKDSLLLLKNKGS